MKLGLIKDDKLLEKIPLVDVRFTHSLCVGQTGSGKTTSFVYPNILKRKDVKVFWLQLGIINDAACQIAQKNGLKAIQNKCTKLEYERYMK